MRVAKSIRFGCVWINDHITICSEMPHGGYKESGYGKDMSIYSVEDYTEIKHVMVNLDAWDAAHTGVLVASRPKAASAPASLVCLVLDAQETWTPRTRRIPASSSAHGQLAASPTSFLA